MNAHLRLCFLLLVLLAGFIFTGKRSTAQPTLDLAAIDHFIIEQMKTQRVPGLALAIIQGDQVRYVKGYGTAGINQPVTPQTQFHIASLSKSFTAVAIMQLVSKVMRNWLPFLIKTLGTLYLLEAPLLLVMRAIVLMFVPSKSAWTDEFQGFQNRTWSVVLLVAFAAFLASGIACWVNGVRLRRGRPHAERTWRYLAALLVGMHILWLIWIFLTADRFLLLHVVQALLVVGLTLYSWVVLPPAFLNQ